MKDVFWTILDSNTKLICRGPSAEVFDYLCQYETSGDLSWKTYTYFKERKYAGALLGLAYEDNEKIIYQIAKKLSIDNYKDFKKILRELNYQAQYKESGKNDELSQNKETGKNDEWSGTSRSDKDLGMDY